ncbi:MAG: glycosyltransferase family 2 protein [Polyangiales bacterium]
MFDGQKVAVVVPAYREALLIGRMLAGVPAFVDRIFVVDDASDDATGEVALAVPDPRITLVRHPVNQGVGAAIATGYAAAFEAGADVAVVMAGDGQMDPEDLPALLAPITHGRADYAKGNRLAWPGAAGRMPLARFVGNHVLSVLTALATGLAIQDSQCGYTALSRRAAEVLPLGSLWARYGYPNDLLGQAAALGLRVVDVPVRPVYGEEKSGIGLRHALFVIPFVLLRVLFRRFASRLGLAPAPEPEAARLPGAE